MKKLWSKILVAALAYTSSSLLGKNTKKYNPKQNRTIASAATSIFDHSFFINTSKVLNFTF